MAIHTKFGDKIINESVHADQDCVFHGEIVKVWAIMDGQTTPKQYWISDLVGDRKKELCDAIHANLKKRGSAK